MPCRVALLISVSKVLGRLPNDEAHGDDVDLSFPCRCDGLLSLTLAPCQEVVGHSIPGLLRAILDYYFHDLTVECPSVLDLAKEALLDLRPAVFVASVSSLLPGLPAIDELVQLRMARIRDSLVTKTLAKPGAASNASTTLSRPRFREWSKLDPVVKWRYP